MSIRNQGEPDTTGLSPFILSYVAVTQNGQLLLRDLANVRMSGNQKHISKPKATKMLPIKETSQEQNDIIIPHY